MAKPRAHLSNAPIVEAIIDIRVQPKPDLAAEHLQSLGEATQRKYPDVTNLVQAQALLGPGTMQHTERANGLLLRSEQKQAAVQFRVDGFAYSKLPLYTSWQEVFQEARRLWDEYVAAATPLAITRLAVRYVNALESPAGGLADLLTEPPRVPAGVEAKMAGFLSRQVIRDEERGLMGVITQALPGAAPARVILDIDVSHPRQVDVGADVTDIFEKLRALKNQIFFASLTEAGIQPYL